MVTRLIDLFVDIAVLLSPGKLVYRFSGTYSSPTPPDSCRVAGYVHHAVTEMSARIATYRIAGKFGALLKLEYEVHTSKVCISYLIQYALQFV